MTTSSPFTDDQGAALLGVSKSQWRRYLARGCPKEPRGAEAWAAKNLVRRVRNGNGKNGSAKAGLPTHLRHATVRHMRSQADAAALALAEIEEQTRSPEDAMASWSRISHLVREQMRGITDAAADLASISDPALVRGRLLDSILDRRRAVAAALTIEAKNTARQAIPAAQTPKAETLEHARARLLDARTKQRSLRLALRRKELLRAAHTDELFMVAGHLAMTRITGLADRLAQEIAAAFDPQKVNAMLRTETRAALDDADQIVQRRIEELIS